MKQAKQTVQQAYDHKFDLLQLASINKQLIREDAIDVSISQPTQPRGHLNLLARERRHVEDVAARLGMRVEYGHDIVTKYENFYSVNIPADHPATEMHDTIYTQQTTGQGENYVLRTHTSAHQVQYMREYGTPLSLLSIGKVYRYEKMDASHDTAFRQIE